MSMPDRPDRYEQKLIEAIADAEAAATKYPCLTAPSIRDRDTLDYALRLYRAVQFGEDTARGAALAEHRAKEADRVDTRSRAMQVRRMPMGTERIRLL